jgi:predicted TIM-barrel fold metal-dependent hydrolase
MIIDADSHVTEPADTWVSRVPSRYRDEVPHIAQEDGKDIWLLNGIKIATVGNTAPAGWPDFPITNPPTYNEVHPASYDAKERLRYMDEVGIWAQVLYPNVAGFGSQNFLNIPDDELKLLCVRAYNDFLHEWASADAERLLAICSLPFWDIAASVAEVERCMELGFRGVLFTGEPQRFGLPTIGNKHWDPLWQVVQDADIPIHFHIGGGEDTINPLDEERRIHHSRMGNSCFKGTSLFLKNGVQCVDLISSGALVRFPDLKFVSVESGIGWIPFTLEAADWSWLGSARPGRVPQPDDLLPSDLFKRQVYCTYWFEHVAPTHLLDVIPIDNILFETDFPHTTCLYGNVWETIDRGLANATPEAREKILWGNAARIYKIKEPATAGDSPR